MNEIRSCKICNRTLYAAEDKKSGVCQDCKLSSGTKNCLKCGKLLSLPSEQRIKICGQCQAKKNQCLKCGTTLYGTQEKGQQLCPRCGRK